MRCPVLMNDFKKFPTESKALPGNGRDQEQSIPGLHCRAAGGSGTSGGGGCTTL